MLAYSIHTFKTGLFSGALDPKKLEETLNAHARTGWRLARTIHEQRRVLLLFTREMHVLIFERDA